MKMNVLTEPNEFSGTRAATALRAAARLAIAAAFAGLVTIATGPARADGIEAKAQICAGCHGENGIPVEKTTPVIWGQNEGYLYIQLRDFKRGTRKNDFMSQVAADLDHDEMMALAEYFSKKPWPDLGQPRAPKEVAAQALVANESVGCAGCHLDRFQGDGTVPRLAGQSRAYLDKTIADLRSRTRANNPGMSDLMNATDPADLAALAQYLAGM